ncbi:glucose-1-phosphate thymidylyltransferase [Haloferax sp. Atlit-6N]|uniref:Bifunctional protein GlmU n=2 Tax=Haloferax gibbonsii TaxID=35746 RepID=A0A871BLL1_HALGI|nr:MULTISPECIES: bifunctional sugar-1-phosphate nucleotidylyltransferase/acetyltransferase [Haloferax]ELZ75702.1 glucose-1-phosphate thymidylyltransferase [Haloferax gibbonsii ATCC 33959]QOS13902.1 sugar nucleotidyltransferase [Haloferax gibbonsii]RDZ50884.1 glucose-1-phosphate thymidylyltransferase [Haloferax sp. Atlit-4N]REA01450.1 glucose-1-phosphate thymidylyltransferase [Haloferax sp. Atlit-6N]
MQAILLAAGRGTRMRPLSNEVPKPMLTVAGRPIVGHTAAAAVEAGADELVMVVGYGQETVREHFGSSYRGVPVSYVEQDEQQGTADAVRAAKEHIDGAFAVLYGDNLYDPAGIDALFDAAPSIASVRVPNPSNYGVLNVSDGAVAEIVEKPDAPQNDLVNAGAYVFPAEARDMLDVPLSERGERELTDVLDRVIDRFNVSPVTLDRWMDVGRPWELLEANEWKLGTFDRRVDGDVSDDATVQGDVVVEEGATVRDGSVVEGPAYISAGATVGPNAYVRGCTFVGPDVHVGHAVEIKNSVLLAETSVGHLSYVGDSVVGRRVNLGAGTNVANLRHDGEAVSVTVKGERVSTGRRKFGAVVGDDAKTGINTALNAGVKLSEGARTMPGETVSTDR